MDEEFKLNRLQGFELNRLQGFELNIMDESNKMRRAICIEELAGCPLDAVHSIHGRLILCKIYEFRQVVAQPNPSLKKQTYYIVYDEVTKTEGKIKTGLPLNFKAFKKHLLEVNL